MLKTVLALLLATSVAACYEVESPVVEKGVRVQGIADGKWLLPDGRTMSVTWDETNGAYQIGAGGSVRLAPVTDTLYLADYQAERRIVMLMKAAPDRVTFYLPTDAVEKTLAGSSGASIKAGPVKILGGAPKSVQAYLAALAGRGDLTEAGHLTRAEN
jgi:hypothetical protein